MKGSKQTSEASTCHDLKHPVSRVTILDPLSRHACYSPRMLHASQERLDSTTDGLSRIIMSNCAYADLWMAVPVASLPAFIPLYQPRKTFVVPDASSREPPEVVSMIFSAEAGTCVEQQHADSAS